MTSYIVKSDAIEKVNWNLKSLFFLKSFGKTVVSKKKAHCYKNVMK